MLTDRGRSTFDMRTALLGRYRISAEATGLRFDIVLRAPVDGCVVAIYGHCGPAGTAAAMGVRPLDLVGRVEKRRRSPLCRVAVPAERGFRAPIFVFDSPWEVAYNDFRFNAAAVRRKRVRRTCREPEFIRIQRALRR